MVIFDRGPEHEVREHLAAFIDEMDERGEAYGTSGDGTSDCEPSLLYRTHGIVIENDDQFVWLILGGSARVLGNEDRASFVGPGEGVYWEARETWGVEVRDEPLVYLEADGPSLAVGHFAIDPPA